MTDEEEENAVEWNGSRVRMRHVVIDILIVAVFGINKRSFLIEIELRVLLLFCVSWRSIAFTLVGST